MSAAGRSTMNGGSSKGNRQNQIPAGSVIEGKGNVETHFQDEEGTGYDSDGRVKTSFGKYPLGYDPVTGMATMNTTSDYTFPAEGGVLGLHPGSEHTAGLADVSAAGNTLATKTFDHQNATGLKMIRQEL